MRAPSADRTQIASIAKKKMTLAIPPGKLRFARQSMKEETSPQANAEAKGGNKQEFDAVVASLDASGGQEEVLVQNGLNGHQLNTDSKGAATVLENFESGWDLTSTEMKSNHETPVIGSNGVNNNSTNPSPDPPSDAVILFEINSLKQLNDKIIDIDGRLNPKDPKEVPAVSPWKIMRAKRNNQDLGTLFEMRDDFYTYKLPYIGKTKRGKK